MSEHSDRARYVTEQVSLWIVNDGEYVADATQLAREGRAAGNFHSLSSHLTKVITEASRYSAPWQVAQELSANDYDRIRWSDVADELL